MRSQAQRTGDYWRDYVVSDEFGGASQSVNKAAQDRGLN
jgi:hypothetical protein